MRRISVLLVVILMVGALVLCSCASSPQGNSSAMDIQVMGGPPGGSGEVAAIAVADVLTKNNPKIRASALQTGGSGEIIVDVQDEDPRTTLFQMTDVTFWQARNGIGNFADDPLTNVRFIAYFGSAAEFWVTLDPDINTPQDFVGKRIGIPQPFIAAGPPSEFALKAYGVWDQIEVSRMSFDALATNLVDGLLDVVFLSATVAGDEYIPTPATMQLFELKKDQVKLIPFTKETVKQASELYGAPLYSHTIPAGALGEIQPEALETHVVISPAIACLEGADDDFIYEVTKTLAGNHTQITEYHPALRGVTPERMVRNLPVDSEDQIHPGALKYYKDAKLWSPPWEE